MFISIFIIYLYTYFSEEQWKVMHSMLDKYYPITKIWSFFIPVVSIRHPDDLQVIKYKNTIIFKNCILVRFRNPALHIRIFSHV